MSAVLSLATPSAAYMLTDRATYDGEGVVKAIGCKVGACRKHPAAIFTRGNMRLGDHWETHLVSLIDRVGLLAAQAMLPEILSRSRESVTVRASHAGRPVEVLLVGWTPLGGFHVRFNSEDWKIEELKPLSYAGPMEHGPTEAAGQFQEGEAPEAWMRRGGVELMTAFRSHRGRAPDGRAADWFAIGGGLDLTIIDAGGVRTETVLEWPDVVGEKIRLHPSAH